ncbi:hypothetical protein [Paraburkholderia tropica]|uniref:hypothetical protein n=1 Tax=Paraburkholderia tropica TaxID=92647 RepID=UPI002AB718A0|nr:hypothetical protein [Paraburkholderia tropica]
MRTRSVSHVRAMQQVSFSSRKRARLANAGHMANSGTDVVDRDGFLRMTFLSRTLTALIYATSLMAVVFCANVRHTSAIGILLRA